MLSETAIRAHSIMVNQIIEGAYYSSLNDDDAALALLEKQGFIAFYDGWHVTDEGAAYIDRWAEEENRLEIDGIFASGHLLEIPLKKNREEAS